MNDLTLKYENFTYEGKNYLTIIPPKEDKLGKQPVILHCVIDTSGSMEKLLIVKGPDGTTTITTLGLVIHCINTIISSLGKEDKLSITIYNSGVSNIFSLSKMTDENKINATNAINKIKSGGNTNMFAGLEETLKSIENSSNEENKYKNKNPTILLFTDGEPSNYYVPKDTNYINIIKKCPCNFTIYTLGFGNSIDRKLLVEIADAGNGSFLYISDVAMVGTVFINFISKLLTLVASNCIVTINENKIKIGSIFLGQSRSFTIPKEDIESITITYNIPSKNYTVKDKYLPQCQEINGTCICEVTRINICSELSKLLNCSDNYLPIIREMIIRINKAIQEITGLEQENTENIQFLNNLIEDINDQVTKAVSPDFYKTWGKFYLQALEDALNKQYCGNFKDRSLQHFGGDLFNTIMNKIRDIFVSLPHPTSLKFIPLEVVNTNNTIRHDQPQITTSVFHDYGGGCFGGNCNVKIPNGSCKVKELKKGNIVATPNGVATVLKVIKYSGTNSIVKYGNLEITPYHPVFVDGEWKFPIIIWLDHSEVSEVNDVYNFILSSEHIITVEGIFCVTLGHNITTNNVVSHDYYGTIKVVNDINAIPENEDGVVVIDYTITIKRDSDTKRVCSMSKNC